MELSKRLLHELKKIGKTIDVEEYKFLDTTPELHTPVRIEKFLMKANEKVLSNA